MSEDSMPEAAVRRAIVRVVGHHYGIRWEDDWQDEPSTVLAIMLWRSGLSKADVARVLGRSPNSDAVRNADKVSGYDHMVRTLTIVVAAQLKLRTAKCSDCGRLFVAIAARGPVRKRCLHCHVINDREVVREIRDRPQASRRTATRPYRRRPTSVTVCGCGHDYMTLPINHQCTKPRVIQVSPAMAR